jgi:outer membrane protein
MMKMRTNHGKGTALLGTLLTFLLVPSAFAAETMPIDLQTALSRAYATHADIRKAEYELDSARATYNAARENFGPKVALTHSTSRGGYWDEQITSTGLRTKGIGNTYNNTVGLTVPIYTGGELEGARDEAKANYRSSVLGEELAYITLKKNVTDAYYTLLSAIDSVWVCQQSVKDLQDHLKNVQAQYDVGVVAKVDLLRSQVELTNAKQTLIQAQNTYDNAEAALNNYMGLPHDTKLKPTEVLEYRPYDGSMEGCIDYGLKNRLDLQQSKLQVDYAKAALNAAKSGWRPYISVTAANNWSNGHWPGDDNENWAVGFNLSMTIFDSGVTGSKVDAAKADLMEAEESYRQDADTVRLDVRNCYNNLREAEKRINTTKLAVAEAEEDYRIAQVRYANGVGTNTDVMDAEVALTTARNNYNTAMYDYNTSYNALMTSMGVEARPDGYDTGNKYLRIRTTKGRYAKTYEEAQAESISDRVKAYEKSRDARRKAEKTAQKSAVETKSAGETTAKAETTSTAASTTDTAATTDTTTTTNTAAEN